MPVCRKAVENFKHVQNSVWAARGQALICVDAQVSQQSPGLVKVYSRATGSHVDE